MTESELTDFLRDIRYQVVAIGRGMKTSLEVRETTLSLYRGERLIGEFATLEEAQEAMKDHMLRLFRRMI